MTKENYVDHIICGDCLEVMKDIPDKSIDMILCDLPYGTIFHGIHLHSNSFEWDIIIPFEPLWKEYKRIIKDNRAIVLTASQPFTSMLIISNLEWFKYEWIWEKSRATGHVICNIRPTKAHENILIFCRGKELYVPQKQPGKPYTSPYSKIGNKYSEKSKDKRLPGEMSITEFMNENGFTKDMARKILHHLVDAGLITVRIDGMYKFYSPKK